jgi:hypothetical protein
MSEGYTSVVIEASVGSFGVFFALILTFSPRRSDHLSLAGRGLG